MNGNPRGRNISRWKNKIIKGKKKKNTTEKKNKTLDKTNMVAQRASDKLRDKRTSIKIGKGGYITRIEYQQIA